MKIESLIATMAVTTVLIVLPPSSSRIQHMAESAALSITLVEYATKFLDKND